MVRRLLVRRSLICPKPDGLSENTRKQTDVRACYSVPFASRIHVYMHAYVCPCALTHFCAGRKPQSCIRVSILSLACHERIYRPLSPSFLMSIRTRVHQLMYKKGIISCFAAGGSHWAWHDFCSKLLNSVWPEAVDERALNRVQQPDTELSTSHALENNTLFLKAAGAVGCSMPSVTPEDLTDGKVGAASLVIPPQNLSVPHFYVHCFRSAHLWIPQTSLLCMGPGS